MKTGIFLLILGSVIAAGGFGLWQAEVGKQVLYKDLYRKIEVTQQKLHPSEITYKELDQQLFDIVQTARASNDLGAAGLGLLAFSVGLVISGITITIVKRQSY